ncbi:MAG: capsular polysaccharide synthesis protein [Carbonactinosporaceae bacterium]
MRELAGGPDATAARTHYRRARANDKARRWNLAATAYEAAIAYDDAPADWHYRLGRVYERAHRSRAARRAYRTGLARTPNATRLDHQLLADNHRRFPARRRIARFVETHLDDIRARALESQSVAATPPRVYVYWARGIDDAPPVVRRCHRELLDHHAPEQVVVLDETSLPRYVDIPDDIRRKVGSNWIKLSDIIRLELLSNYGGVWIDATCLVRTGVLDVITDLLPSGFFAFRRSSRWPATWLLASEPNSDTIALWRQAQYTYWRHFDRPIDYYILHHIFEALCHVDGEFRARWEETPALSAQPAHAFKQAMHDPYEVGRFRFLLDGSFVHKLTYKRARYEEGSDTLLSRLVDCGPTADLAA